LSRRDRSRGRLAALDRIEPSGFAIDRPHRQPRRQRRDVNRSIERIGRSGGENRNLRRARLSGTGARRGQRGANVGLVGGNVVTAGYDGADAFGL
jgi:hypothetical protein